MSDLFTSVRPSIQEFYPQVWLLANFVETGSLFKCIKDISLQAPFRKMMTPMGHYTGIPFTNCGDWGWTSDAHGYRYSNTDPDSKTPWPTMPEVFSELATSAANKVGFKNFQPDACLINQYDIGSKLSAHQDKNEADFSWPIVSVSIGLTAEFQIFGNSRTNKPVNLQIFDGDVMVWGGNSRLIYHGVKAIKSDKQNPALNKRYNITFRKAK